MRMTLFRFSLLVLALACPSSALAAVNAGQPFPSNLYTTPDSTQLTGLRVDLPQPNCATNPSDCADVAVLNQLDGFNIQPRISVPFSAPIDLATVSSSTIFLAGPGGQVVGINQVVWEPARNTLHFESDQQLAQDTTYLLVVTRRVRGADGQPLDGSTFRRDLNFGQTKDPAAKVYRKALLAALPMAMVGGANPSDIAVASVFTTQSIDAVSRKIREQLVASPVNFNLGTSGERTVFPLASVSAITWQRQIATAPTFSSGGLFLPLLAGVGTIAFGAYASPDYETTAKVIPPYGTATGTPAPQGANPVQFALSSPPASSQPVGGRWPSSATGSRTGRTARLRPSRAPSRGTESRRWRSTWSATAVGRSGSTRSAAWLHRP